MTMVQEDVSYVELQSSMEKNQVSDFYYERGGFVMDLSNEVCTLVIVASR